LPFRARNRQELNRKLNGSTLGDESSGDTKAWLKQQKRANEIAADKARVAKREKEEADLDALGYDELYTESRPSSPLSAPWR
jgi:hypothetical protein